MQSEVIKTIQIILILSPFFLTVFSLAWLIKNGLSKLEKHATYWLIGLIIMLILLTVGVMSDTISPFAAILGYVGVERYYSTYIRVKHKNNKKS